MKDLIVWVLDLVTGNKNNAFCIEIACANVVKTKVVIHNLEKFLIKGAFFY